MIRGTLGFRGGLMGLATVAGMMASMDRGYTTPTLPSPPVLTTPKADKRRKKKGPKPEPQNRKHLQPQSAFMRQIAEERAIGIHPKYRHSSARLAGPTAAEWEAKRDEWRKAGAA